MKFLATWVLSIAVLFGGQIGHAQSDVPPAKLVDIQKLLEITGASDMTRRLAQLMVRHVSNLIQQRSPSATREIYDEVSEIISSVIDDNLPRLMTLSGELYHQHFSHAEILALIEFYETDVGKKSIEVMPKLMQESMIAGQRWGESLMPEIRKRVNKRLGTKGVTI